MTAKYILLSDRVISHLLQSRQLRGLKADFSAFHGVHRVTLGQEVEALAVGGELPSEFVALVNLEAFSGLAGPPDVLLTRIGRLLAEAGRPPIHLPRSWAEYHSKNCITFFAQPEDQGRQRWLAAVDSLKRVIGFLDVSDKKKQIRLEDWNPEFPQFTSYADWASKIPAPSVEASDDSFSSQVDLEAIGSKAVAQGYVYEEWLARLRPEQLRVVNAPAAESIRVVGPAGSGKTLALCMRALRLARDTNFINTRKKILIVTHSWAMTERIDGVLQALNGGTYPSLIDVAPLLYLLQAHAGAVGQIATSVLGEDSADGQKQVMDLVGRSVEELSSRQLQKKSGLSSHLVEAIGAEQSSRVRSDLVLDLYEEIIGILSPTGTFPDAGDKVAEYLSAARDETLPPFKTKADREFVLAVYAKILEQLVDLGAVTTDQLVADAIRVFETFSWNVRRETEGYDYILIDELQLFDSQERLAISLLSRSKPGMEFLSVEDPSQGLFSRVNERTKALKARESYYLEEPHRFRAGLVDFIAFLYRKFPLNQIPLKFSTSETVVRKPRLFVISSKEDRAEWCRQKVASVMTSKDRARRICFVCLGDEDQLVYDALKDTDYSVVRMMSYDDVEKLSYQKRSVVIAQWQYVGGTQFTDVALMIPPVARPANAHARLRELTSIYLGTSRASSDLDIVCTARVPEIIQEAKKDRLITETKFQMG